MGLSPVVALTTEHRLSLSHRFNLRLPVLDFACSSLPRTCLIACFGGGKPSLLPLMLGYNMD
jgi:hypothetical protein